LSDVFGVSALVEAINHPNNTGSGITDSTILGPFYVAMSPEMPLWANIAQGVKGIPSFNSGYVLDIDGNPIEGV